MQNQFGDLNFAAAFGAPPAAAAATTAAPMMPAALSQPPQQTSSSAGNDLFGLFWAAAEMWSISLPRLTSPQCELRFPANPRNLKRSRRRQYKVPLCILGRGLVLVNGDHGGLRLDFVEFNLGVPPSCLFAMPSLPNVHLPKQSEEQPNQCQQNSFKPPWSPLFAEFGLTPGVSISYCTSWPWWSCTRFCWLRFGEFPGWWAAIVATYCPSRMVEYRKSNSTKPCARPPGSRCMLIPRQ